MWQIITPEQDEEFRKAAQEHWERSHEEHKRKAEALRDWLMASTCPHCGQHPPTPPWFAGITPAPG
jgi:hypothetical protein